MELVEFAGPDTAATSLSPSQFRSIRATAYQTFGLDLKPGKEALVSARISKRLRELGLRKVDEYLRLVETDATGGELVRLIDALTTNYTSFGREPAHFDVLRREVLLHEGRRARDLKIWSAGCATGEEPYTILMHVVDTLGEAALSTVRLVASDISNKALEAARAGVYPQERVASLPQPWVHRCFQQGTGASHGFVRIKENLRAAVDFRRINLMDSFHGLPRFDVIFCRNVMIYFDKPTQERLVGRFSGQLAPGGWLFIGHSEGLMGVRHDLEYVAPATYRKPA